MKKIAHLLMGRLTIVGVSILLQICWLFLVLWKFSYQFTYANLIIRAAAIVLVLVIANKWENPANKLSWTFLILLSPILGIMLYFLFGRSGLTKHTREQMDAVNREVDACMPVDEEAVRLLQEADPSVLRQSKYIADWGHFPVYRNTATKYYESGEAMFPDMLAALESAEHFIFLEYFIIEEGVMWDTILDILREKAAAGLDVRVLYDDVGSICTLPKNYDRYLMSLGIHAVRFNRFIPTLNTYLNYRNHRKMTIIDGNVGYMGGINLADEYINKKVRFGYWKDTGIMLRGEGTANMTALFLQMWEYVTGEDMPPLENYLPTAKLPADGYVQPFADSPLDDINIGESTYLQIIHNARKYVYITTPYLVLDNEMITALTIAAQSGVDVRILTPGIPDKKLVYMITRSYYQQLHRAGVKIYEYRPGFLHAKTIVSDDDTAVVGTINMDFRSFFLHFECATCFYNSSVVAAVKQDIMETINVSRRIDDEWLRRVPWIRSIMASVLRLFAPLL